MSEEIIKRVYKRLEDYSQIMELAVDNPKISNLAKIERDLCFVYLIENGGLEILKKGIENSKDSRLIINLLVLMAPFDKKFALEKYKYFLDKNDPVFIISQPWGLDNMQNEEFHKNTLKYIEDLRKKMKLKYTK